MALLYRMGTGNGSGGDLKPFIVNFTCHSGFVGKTVTMEFQGIPHAGETVDNVSGTVASDGTLTLYPMHDGLWKYYATSGVSGYHEGTITLEKWGNYPVELKDIPNGATATPTDDVQTWLHCADIWDKSYTRVDEVIADKIILNALVQNENANDYLVRSTTFANTLCENNVNNEAMYYLGLYSECANKLLADDTWSEAICNADVLLSDGVTHLFEKVLNVKVPRMTSNTKPSGEASASSTMNTNTPAWKAFDGTSSGWGRGLSASAPHWIQYKFSKPTIVKKIGIESTGRRSFTYKLQGSNNDTDFVDIANNMSATESYLTTDITNNEPYLIYRVLVVKENGLECGVRNLQFYGREGV